MRLIGRVAPLAFVLMLAPVGAAQADTFKVNKLGDPTPGACTNNHCSLREAVLKANNDSPGADKVLLPNRRNPYRLTIPNTAPPSEDGNLEGDLDVTNDPLAIVHKGKGLATIASNGVDRVIEAFERLSLKRIKVTGGGSEVSIDGGGINAEEQLSLRNSRVTGNSGNDGGGIEFNGPNLRVVNSAISNNRSEDDGAGVRMVENEATVVIARSRISGNDASASPSAQGGGIDFSGENSTLSVLRSTFTGNTALEDGGAINFDNPGVLRVKSSTFAENRAVNGGALYLFDGSGSIVNSTISGNRALDFGGGVFVGGGGELGLNAVTIVRNHGSTDDTGAHAPGGGIFRHTTGTVSVRNSILALNKLGTEPIRNDCGGEVGEPFASLGNNLLSTLAPSGICNGFDEAGDRVRSNPKLGKLKRNGGPTKTVALKKGSPAIGKAHKPSAPNRDQRGRKRDSEPDIGAFERGA